MGHALGAAPIRALIVEDNRDICENIATYLEKHRLILDFAYDGISAMHLALTSPFDVIVLDLMLPGMDGLSFCQKLRADAKVETPVLMLTARDTLEDKLGFYPVFTDGYKTPENSKSLLATLRRIRGLWNRSM